MKKIIALFCAFCVVASFSACGTNNNTIEKETEKSTERLTEETTDKETNKSIDGYEYANFDKFNSYAEDNGLENTAIYIKGIVKNVNDFGSEGSGFSFCNLSISTGDKEGWLCTFALPYSEGVKTILDEKEVTCFGKYIGWSDVMLKPSMLIDKIVVDGKTYDVESLTKVVEENSMETPTEGPTEKPTEEPTRNTEKLIFNNNGIKITYKGIGSGWLGQKVNLGIENNSGKDYTIQVRDVSVNGYMVDPSFSCDVNDGKMANDGISFSKSDFEDNNIEEINNIELHFIIFNQDDWSDDFETEMITINP